MGWGPLPAGGSGGLHNADRSRRGRRGRRPGRRLQPAQGDKDRWLPPVQLLSVRCSACAAAGARRRGAHGGHREEGAGAELCPDDDHLAQRGDHGQGRVRRGPRAGELRAVVRCAAAYEYPCSAAAGSRPEHWFDSQLPRNPADMYYEAQLEDCDPAKNFVMVGGTNGASHLYQDIIAHFRSRGYCTLNFVPPPPLLPSTLLRLLSLTQRSCCTGPPRARPLGGQPGRAHRGAAR